MNFFKVLRHIVLYMPVLAYWLMCGVIPLVAVVQYYHPYGMTYVKFYGAFFIYPVFFGWIPVFFIVNIYRFLNTNVLTNWRLKRELWLGVVVFSSVLAAVDLSSDNIAPFEIERGYLTQTKIVSLDGTTSVPLIAYFDRAQFPDGHEVDCEIDDPDRKDVRCRFQDKMLDGLGNKLFPTKESRWSPTRYLYIISLTIQCFTLLTFMFTIALILKFRIENGNNIPNHYYNLLIQIGLGVVVAFFWIILRVSFMNDKLDYFPGRQNYITEYVVLIMFNIVLVFLSLSFWNQYRDVILAMAGVLLGGSGLFVIFRYPDAIAEAFSQQNIISSSFLSLLGLAGVGYCLFLIRNRHT